MDWPPIDWAILSRDITAVLAVLSFVAQLPIVQGATEILLGMLQDYREHLDEQRDQDCPKKVTPAQEEREP